MEQWGTACWPVNYKDQVACMRSAKQDQPRRDQGGIAQVVLLLVCTHPGSMETVSGNFAMQQVTVRLSKVMLEDVSGFPSCEVGRESAAGGACMATQIKHHTLSPSSLPSLSCSLFVFSASVGACMHTSCPRSSVYICLLPDTYAGSCAHNVGILSD